MASQAGRVAPDLCRAPTSVVGCPPGQKRNSDVRGSTHTLLVPLGVPEDDPLHVLRLIWPDQNPAATARLRPHASISNGAGHGEGYKSPFEASGLCWHFFAVKTQ